jgi:uncharacterized protein
MLLINRARSLSTALGVAAMLAIAAPAAAQEIAEPHLAAALSAIDAIKATDEFDSILPQAAQALKAELIQKDPNLQGIIIATVDEKTLELAGRRGDLEREAALAYARVFSERELKEIAAFYASPTGQKLISDGPIVTREVLQAVQIWQRGVARDLSQAVGTTLAASLAGNQAQPQAGEAGVIQQPVSEAEGAATAQ